MKILYPQWIDEYAKATHAGFLHMVPVSWGPIDAMALIGFLNGSFLAKLSEAVERIKAQKIPTEKVAQCFPSPSSLYCALYYTALEYQYCNPKNKEHYREIIEFLTEVLRYLRKKDTFSYESNIVHTHAEVSKILYATPWAQGNFTLAKELGKLYTILSGLVEALYGDFFPQESNEAYGPYDASEKFGENTILVTKHFPKIRPVELWPEMKELKYSDIKILQVYHNVKFTCELIGRHSLWEGDVINNLVAYAIMLNGKFQNQNKTEDIRALVNYFTKITTKRSLVYENLSKEERKKKVLEWLCYQFVYLFQLGGMDWRPTQQMVEAVKGKDVQDRFEQESPPSLEEYTTNPEYEVYWLKDLYTNV